MWKLIFTAASAIAIGLRFGHKTGYQNGFKDAINHIDDPAQYEGFY